MNVQRLSQIFIRQRFHLRTHSQAFATQSQTETKRLKGWRKYAHQFRDKPASYIISFAVLHELTAVIPLPMVYYTLKYTDLKVPFPQEAIEEGNKFASRIKKKFGYNEVAEDSRVMLNIALSYCIVKALLPVRIAASVWMTPWFAERVISPITRVAKWLRIVKKQP
ncbi:uncharacterized protein VTP21DRAFT_11396 [Calcarisporiella thermophila]|uniref:uncharacterized protein n=1 Tax=Calcarisporiella thermophila TaxID=911321 RepID=UPI0037444C2C